MPVLFLLALIWAILALDFVARVEVKGYTNGKAQRVPYVSYYDVQR